MNATVTDLLCACDDVAAAVAFEADLGAGAEIVSTVELVSYVSGPMLSACSSRTGFPPPATARPT